MKIKFLLFLTVISLLLSLGSCVALNRDCLMYQKYPFDIIASFKLNAKEYKAEITMTEFNKGSITFTSPDVLKGYVFDVYENEVYVRYDDMSILLPSDNIKTCASAIIRLFSIDIEKLNSVKLSHQNGLKLNEAVFLYDEGEKIKVIINTANEMPVCITAEFHDINLTLNIQKLTLQEEIKNE